jgi:hypothetical protein
MEDLVLWVMIIISSVILLGLMAALAMRASSGSFLRRLIGLVIGLLAAAAGAFLALLEIGIGVRAVGGVVFILGVSAVVNNLRRGRTNHNSQ